MVKQEFDGRKIDEFLCGFICMLIVAGESAEAVKPSECSLHDPSERLWGETLRAVWSVGDFKFNGKISLDGINDFAPISSVSKNLFDGEPYVFSSTHKFVGEFGVMYSGRVNASSKDETIAVNHDATFYSFDAFVGIETVVTLMITPLDTLSVQCAYAWGCILFPFTPDLHNHLLDAEFNASVVSPLGEVPIYGLPFWKVLRQHSPLTTADQNKEYGLKDGAEGIFAFATIILKEYFVYIRPLTLGQMCLIEVFFMHIKTLFLLQTL